jgi:hypothetical protein
MAVSAYAIPTLAEVKSYLKIGDTNSDTILEGWIDRASHGIEKYCGRKFAVQSITSEIHDGTGDDRLYTNYFPITQLSTETTPSSAQKLAALQKRDTPDDSWEDIEDDIDHIFLNDDWQYILLYDRFFPVGTQNIRVSYKAGFTVIPGDVWQVSLEMVAEMWNNSKQSGQDRLGRASRSMGQFTDSFRSLRPEWREVLNRYRLGSTSFSQTPIYR